MIGPMIEFVLSEPPLILAAAVIIPLAAWIFVRSWSAWNNFGLLCFFIVMAAMSGWFTVATFSWSDPTVSFISGGFTALMVLGAITSLIALVREDPLG